MEKGERERREGRKEIKEGRAQVKARRPVSKENQQHTKSKVGRSDTVLSDLGRFSRPLDKHGLKSLRTSSFVSRSPSFAVNRHSLSQLPRRDVQLLLPLLPFLLVFFSPLSHRFFLLFFFLLGRREPRRPRRPFGRRTKLIQTKENFHVRTTRSTRST